ncbi:MAG: trigger factor [Clostridiales bacterium]|jgi:trigger factor|nr:trigger factor [Clostridiales bacterium]
MATFEKLENNKIKMTVEINAASFDEALQNAYIKTRSKYNVPGFRKGKAPKKMIETMYGEGVLYEDAFELVYGEAYNAAIDECKLEPIERPSIDIEKIGAGEGVIFSAEFGVKPEVVLGKYKGIEVVRRTYTVEDAEVDRLIEQEREKIARYVEMDRPVENGDRVLLDYSGSIDGVQFDGGTAKEQELEIGSNTFMPGFEEQLIGMQKGEEKDISVNFPEEYHAEDLRGKAAVFAVKINGVQVKELPELDDEFAKDISEFDTLEELKNDKRVTLQRHAGDMAKNEMEEEAIAIATGNAIFDVPEAMVSRQMDILLRNMAYRLSMSGISMENYSRYTGSSVQDIREKYRDEAQKRVRISLVLEAIVKAEGLEATEEETDREIEEYAKSKGESLDAFKEEHGDDREYFKDRVTTQKAIDFLLENAKWIDEPKEDAAPKEDAMAAREAAPEKDAKPKEEKIVNNAV